MSVCAGPNESVDTENLSRAGFVTIAGDPITVVRLLIVTSGFLIVSTLLTVALVVIFPGITMSYHIHLIEHRVAERDEG